MIKMKMKRIVNRIIGVTPITRRINAVYEINNEKYETPIFGMAEVIYTDGNSGFELVGGRVDETVDIASEGKGFKGFRDLDYIEYRKNEVVSFINEWM